MPFRVGKFVPITYEALKPMETLLASAKPLPKGPKTGGEKAKVATISKETPATVFAFKKISHAYKPQKDLVSVSAQIVSKEKIAKSELIYQIKGQERVAIDMTEGKSGSFQASIPLPPKSGEAKEGEGEVTYKVKPGDNLGIISKKFYGEKKKWIMIATYNRLANPNLIYVDQVLKIKTSGQFENVFIDAWVKATLASDTVNLSPKKTILVTR